MGNAPVATKLEESGVRVPDAAEHGHARSLGLRPEKIHFTPHTLDVVDGRMDALLCGGDGGWKQGHC